ncbi:MAG: hypothetical protein E7062_00660 [Spirochaetaceae bacterium]|nr:hypothetical protein [Spirochaetaceae bacterium]
MKTSESQNKTSKKPVSKILLSIGSIAILVFAAISFVFIPALAQVGGSTLPPFGKYNGRPIEYKQGSTFANNVQYFSEMIKQSGQNLTEESYFYLFNEAFNATVLSYGYEDEIATTGYKVASKAVDRFMIPYFSDANGKYSQKLYSETPNAQKIALRENAEEYLTNQAFIGDYFGKDISDTVVIGGLKTSSKEIPFIKAMEASERSFEVASFPLNSYPESEALVYAKENSALFVRYPMNILTLDTEEQAKKILSQLKKEELTFEDAVKEYSTKAYSDENGKLTNDYEFQITKILADVAQLATIKALAIGETSSVIETKAGYSIFTSQGEAIQPDFANSTLVKVVLDYINTNEAGLVEEYVLANAKDFAISATNQSFASAAKKYNATTTKTALFPLNYSNSQLIKYVPSDSIPELQGCQLSENFLKTAFSLKKGEISTPVVLGKNIVVLKMIEEKTDDLSNTENLKSTYPDVTNQFEQMAVSNFFMKSDKLVNNFATVYFNNLTKN